LTIKDSQELIKDIGKASLFTVPLWGHTFFLKDFIIF